MKYIIAFLIICTSIQAQVIKQNDKLDGKDPTELLKNFFMPLKKGAEGIQETLDVSNNVLNNKSNQFAQNELSKQGTERKDQLDHSDIGQILKNDLQNGNKLEKIKLLDKDLSKLNGNIQTYSYRMIYSDGKTRDLKFKLLKPTINGGYFLIGIDAE